MEYSVIVLYTTPTGRMLRFLSFPTVLEKALDKLSSLTKRPSLSADNHFSKWFQDHLANAFRDQRAAAPQQERKMCSSSAARIFSAGNR
ncbi:hypothetical protein A0H81_10937 [Grifola frondosa]|uniref:ArsA/GET3 Anion-transporting ATPase-like domain-containing protein n=1 Tax=Grifola frondosa TaxID=5627 RepID=A0A1C7LYL6_GRIFR|nr:hypothetical protein A0H81_10937 [Grifola frondosa]